MIRVFFTKFLVLFLMSVFWVTTVAQSQSGADTYLYSPQYSNFDNFSNSGDISLQLAAGAIAKSVIPGLRLAYSPINDFGVGANYFSFVNSSSQFERQETKVEMVSGDIFYYRNLDIGEEGKWELTWRVGAGYGGGKVSRQYFSNLIGEATLGIQKYILETGCLISGTNVGFGIGLRGKYFNYSNQQGFGEIPNRELEKLDYIINVAPDFLIDLNTRFEFGGQYNRLFISFDVTLNSFENKNNLISSLIDKESIHLGYYFLINKAINKKNIEK